MAKQNDFSKEPNVTISGTIGVEMYTKLRKLQQKGHEQANWSNVFRRGARLILDCAEGNDPYVKIEKLVTTLSEQTQK